MQDPMAPLTEWLRAWQGGDLAARDQLMEHVYGKVRAIATQSLRRQGQATLSATELAHESLLRLLGADASWDDRRHFFHVVAQATRHVLVDHARRRLSDKRGGGSEPITLGAAELLPAPAPYAQVLGLNDSLDALASTLPRCAEVLELSYFGGYSREEIAAALQISTASVDRELRFGRAWLKSQLAEA